MKKNKPRIGNTKTPVPSIPVHQIHKINNLATPQPLTNEIRYNSDLEATVYTGESKIVYKENIPLCHSCKWFDIPIRGKKTCNLKGLAKDKCSDYKEKNLILDQELKAITKDPFVSDINFIITNSDFLLPLREYNYELKQFMVYNKTLKNHVLRKVPKHIETMGDFQILEEVLEETQAFRDRITTMRIEVLEKKSKYDKIWRNCRAWLLQFSYYTSIKTKDDRLDCASTIFKPFFDYLTDMKETLKRLDLVMDNLNTTYYLTKTKFDIAKIVIERYKNL